MNAQDIRIADIAKHRVEMKRRLRRHGFPVDNDETTERLEELVRFTHG